MPDLNLQIPFKDIAACLSPSRLRLLILPTEKCNFRCTYCYEDFAVGRMNAAIANGVVAFVHSHAASLDFVDIDWFGGEPLIAKDIVYDISSRIKAICQQEKVTYRGSITTNGFLLNGETAEQLIRCGVTRFQVSLDGPREIHDVRRFTANGKPTFDIITGNVAKLLSTDWTFQLLLRIHFDKTTFAHVREFVQSVVRNWAADTRVDVLFVHVENLSEDPDAHVTQMGDAEREHAIEELRRFVRKGVTKKDFEYVCYAAQPHSFVIRADGRVGKCTVALNDDRNTIGCLTEGGHLIIDAQKSRIWLMGWEKADSATLACPYSAIKSGKI